MNFQIHNDSISVVISSLGAELQSVYRSDVDFEYLWQGDTTYWKGRAPILFPIVGGLKDQKYLVKGQEYSMPNHGIARISEFVARPITDSQICFILMDSDETKKRYPFSFELSVLYTLDGCKLLVDHVITNTSETEEMPFLFGLHPAFNLDDNINSSAILFEDEDLISDVIIQDGFFIFQERSFGRQKLLLTDRIFDQDALVFQHLKTRSVTLVFENSKRFVTMSWDDNLPILALWSKPGASFVCIEPWCGQSDNLADSVSELIEKSNIIILSPKQSKKITYTLILS